jgi:5-methylcytosine-specific restriction endonuclease McrA
MAGGCLNYTYADWARRRSGTWAPPTGAIRAGITIYTKDAWRHTDPDAWRAASRRAFGSCELCGVAFKILEAHHLHYRTVGRETLWDLLMLCRQCHFDEHRPPSIGRRRFIVDPEKYQAELWVERNFEGRKVLNVNW